MLQLIACSGNVRLAAEKLHVSVPELTEQLLELDEERLQTLLRKSLLLQLLDSVSNARVALISGLGEMTAKELIDTFGMLVNHTNSLLDVRASDAPESTHNSLTVIPREFSLTLGDAGKV